MTGERCEVVEMAGAWGAPALETRWARVRQIYPRQNYNLANCALSSVNSARIAAVKVGRTSPIAIR